MICCLKVIKDSTTPKPDGLYKYIFAGLKVIKDSTTPKRACITMK